MLTIQPWAAPEEHNEFLPCYESNTADIAKICGIFK